MLAGKKILLGITGSIAAYKSATLVRSFVKQGAEVQVIMTPLAKEFITPLTLATLSKNHVPVEFFNPENGDWNSHVSFGLWADVFLIAPATANTISKMANGIADNLLLTTYLSAKCPVFIAPAMDLDMYKHPATKKSIDILKSYGNYFIEPSCGELASGLSGKGRMEEPEKIVEILTDYFQKKNSLKNKKVLITAGPTHEKIDAVRFIGNYSSGKMGYALAEECATRGANVFLVSGPVNMDTKNTNITKFNITSAEQMYDKAKELFVTCDIAIFSAAVADFTPESPSENKFKRKGDSLNIMLKPTKDIAAELGKEKTPKQITVGFALEKVNELKNAKLKIEQKNFDFIVLNSLNELGAGFNSETNKITIIDNKNNTIEFNIKPKNLVAIDIIDKLEEFL